MDIIQGVVGGVIKTASAVKESRDRKKDYNSQKDVREDDLSHLKYVREDGLAMSRERHNACMETEGLRKEKETIEVEMRRLELQRMKESPKDIEENKKKWEKLTIRLQKIDMEKVHKEKEGHEKEMQRLELKLKEVEISKQTDKDGMLMKAVDESDVITVTWLIKCIDELNVDTITIAQEMAQEKGNKLVIKLIGLAIKKIEGKKVNDVKDVTDSSDRYQMPPSKVNDVKDVTDSSDRYQKPPSKLRQYDMSADARAPGSAHLQLSEIWDKCVAVSARRTAASSSQSPGLLQSKDENLKVLQHELSNLDTFANMLQAVEKRNLLHKCFQVLMDMSIGEQTERISSVLAKEYQKRCQSNNLIETQIDKLVEIGLGVSSFLFEAGWLPDTEIMLTCCHHLIYETNKINQIQQVLECCHRLLHVQTGFKRFEEAEKTFNSSLLLVNRLHSAGVKPNLASLYSVISYFYMLKSNFAEAYSWTIKSLQEVGSNYPRSSPLIDILRQAAKTFIHKRDFKKAGLLIKKAVIIASEVLDDANSKFADTLLDYGYYLLNIDAIDQSVEAYETALKVRQTVFGGINFYVAQAHEDLAYAAYSQNYSSGQFTLPKTHAELAIELWSRLIPADHPLSSDSKRIKALIIEEMAIDSKDQISLVEAHSLHKQSLAAALQLFGEKNVQTAKNYGNLGRLYQSMELFEKAEEMHLKAISIKEQLLGPEDNEVALSVGHLASLYNYDMEKYGEAEKLYLRSIDIGKKSLGSSYSGLEYDYRGLIRVYTMKGNSRMTSKFNSILSSWELLRAEEERKNAQTSFSDSLQQNLLSLQETINKVLAQ